MFYFWKSYELRPAVTRRQLSRRLIMPPSYRRLQQCALAISIISILYNGAEAAVSIGLGKESSSRSLILFGVQSGIEVISASIVLWRFKNIAKPGEERGVVIGPKELRFVLDHPRRQWISYIYNYRIEKMASACIGGLLVGLAISTEIVSISGLALRSKPQSSNASLIVSASALVLMVLIWLPKRYLARELNSSAMAGEATCSLSCLQITAVLFVGSLIYRLRPSGWWADDSTSLVLGLMFGWEGYKLVKWVRDPDFDGGCCKACQPSKDTTYQYRDLCDCCAEKPACKDAGECLCASQNEEV